eukprot:642848_1
MLILNELYEATLDFQESLRLLWNNSHRKQWLKLNQTHINNTQFVVSFADKYTNDKISDLTKDKMTFVCGCLFSKRQSVSITDVIGSKYMIDGESLNINKKANYLMVNMKSLLDTDQTPPCVDQDATYVCTSFFLFN